MATRESTTSEFANGVLATDLDGTLIPLSDCSQNQTDLKRLSHTIREQGIQLLFVTGRHLSSVEDAIKQFALPAPDWVICDVGTSVFRCTDSGTFEPVTQYADRLSSILGMSNIQPLAEQLKHIPALRLQEDEKQGPFKLSYYVDAQQLDAVSATVTKTLNASKVEHELISSVDPFNGDGLIDILPLGVSKAFALNWWISFQSVDEQSVIFSGDSGNDLAAMIAGYKTIVVGNADPSLSQQVSLHHKNKGWENRLFLADSTATSGVLEGLQFFSKL